MAAEFEVFRIERRGAVALVWLNRPEKLNAMAPVFFRELPAVLAEAAVDPDHKRAVMAFLDRPGKGSA